MASFVAIFVVEATAQLPDYQLSLMHAQDGLKTSGIIGMVRDVDGFMWLASAGHVQRFDGRSTKYFSFQETVHEIYPDKKNRKWVITGVGIFRLQNSEQDFKEIGFEQPGEMRVIHVYEDNEGRFCAARRDGHHYYDENLDRFRRYEPSMIPANIPYTRYFGKIENAFVFSVRDTLYQYSSDTWRLSRIHFNRINKIILLRPDEFLVSTTRLKTFYVNINSGTVMPLSISPAKGETTNDHLILYSGVLIGSNHFLITSNKGLLEYDYSTRKFRLPVFYYNGRRLENQQTSTHLYKDRFGTVYMNHADGIFFMTGTTSPIQYFRNYRYEDEQMPDNDVRNFSEDEHGNIWMATTNGIARLSMQNGALKVYSPLNRTNFIDFPSYRQLVHDKHNLWIGSSGNGIWILNMLTGKYSRPVFANTDEGRKAEQLMDITYVWKILKLQDGRFFIAGGGRAFLVDPQTFEARLVHFRTSSIISRSAYQDSGGRIWHGTVRGLSCMDSRFNTLFYLVDSFPNKRIASFCEQDSTTMLVGSKGLYEVKVKNGKLASFRKRNGVPANRFIYCMKMDRQGYVWLGTDEGIFRYDPARDESVTFDESDHVQSQSFNSDAAFLSSKGIMYMGGLNGVNYFDPAKVSSFAEPLHPVIISFATNAGDSFLNTGSKRVEIAYNNRDIDFAFTAPQFKKPFRILYRYSLGNGEWTPTGTHSRVRINNLRPRNYSLQVSASYDGKSWFTGNTGLSFRILKPWWQTWWFRLLSLVAFMALIWTFVRYRTKRREALEIKRTIEYFAHSGSEYSSTEDILWDIARNCISRLGLEDCVIYLVEEDRQMLVQKAAYGDKSPRDFVIANPIEIPIGSGICGHVAKTARPLIINDTSRDNRYIVDDENRLSEITVPIIYEGKVIGIIDSEHSKKNFFKKGHLNTLQTIASLCSKKISASIAMEAVKKAEVELESLNNKMQESNFKNLRLQMNPHFLFNILTTIQYLIVSQQTNKATNYLNIFSGFLRSILQYAEDTVVSLQEELRILKMYIELESLCLDETFAWELKVAEDIDQEEVHVPFMLFQPFVENAIHHGLMQKPGEKNFRICIEDREDDYLSCIIEDNGIGRAMAATKNGKSFDSVIHKSRGIDIVKQRLELMRQKTAKGAGVEIEDMYENGVATGTKVHIILSYYNKEDL